MARFVKVLPALVLAVFLAAPDALLAQPSVVILGTPAAVYANSLAETSAQDNASGQFDFPPTTFGPSSIGDFNLAGGPTSVSADSSASSTATAGRSHAESSASAQATAGIVFNASGSLKSLNYSGSATATGTRTETLDSGTGSFAYAEAGSTGVSELKFRFQVISPTQIRLQSTASVGGSPWVSAYCRLQTNQGQILMEGHADSLTSTFSLDGSRFLSPGIYLLQSATSCGGGSGVNHPFLSSTGSGTVSVSLQFDDPLGTCCLPDGSCDQLTDSACLSDLGIYWGPYVSCEQHPCHAACCLPSGECQDLSQQTCEDGNGYYHGPYGECAYEDCVGACCLPTGGCELMSNQQCDALEGYYNGDGSSCVDSYCPPVVTITTTPLRTCKLTTAEFHALPSCGAQGGDWTYQWWKYDPYFDWFMLLDDDRITGSATDTLSIANLGLADSTYYTVEVGGPCGLTYSELIWLDFKGEDLNNPDDNADGDGIPDCWETESAGMDVNDDGIADLDLYARGASPDHKDLFVEVDGMLFIDVNGFQPAFGDVIQAFADAPVENPDQAPGIRLHLEFDQTQIPYEEYTPVDCTGYPTHGTEWKTQYFGSPTEQADANWEQIRAAKLKAYRWCVLLSRPQPVCCGFPICTTQWEGLLGIAELPGEDFAVYADQMAGRHLVVDLNQHELIPYLVAETFMHELGHTLGLHHGGGDDINGKPNYRSVMNYTGGLTADRFSEDGIQPLDYSRKALPALFEYDLDEHVGISGGYEYELWTMPFGFTIGGKRQYRFVPLNGQPIDFGAQDASLVPDDQITTHSRQDLNYFGKNWANGPEDPSPNQELMSFEDWHALQYAIVNGSGLAAFSEPPAENEPTLEQVQWRLSWPPVQADCVTSDIPRILNEPLGVTVAYGATLALSVVADGAAPLAYQWVKDSSALADANTNTYQVAVATRENAGAYKVWVNNGCGGTESDTVVVNVLPPPGDVDLDGDVDLTDLALLLQGYGACDGNPAFNPNADFDDTGCIDLADLAQLLANYGR